MKSENPGILAGIKVLVVDDEPDALTVTELMLGLYQAEVIASPNAANGLENVQRHRPDIIVSDLSMPRMDGYQFIQAVRNLPLEQGKNTPAVALSAFNRVEDRARAINAGFQKYLCKPVALTDLIETVAGMALPCRL
jgi:CheY-like chemotaxis protein